MNKTITISAEQYKVLLDHLCAAQHILLEMGDALSEKKSVRN